MEYERHSYSLPSNLTCCCSTYDHDCMGSSHDTHVPCEHLPGAYCVSVSSIVDLLPDAGPAHEFSSASQRLGYFRASTITFHGGIRAQIGDCVPRYSFLPQLWLVLSVAFLRRSSFELTQLAIHALKGISSKKWTGTHL